MLKKIKRDDCLKMYPVFPLHNYNADKDEEEFYHPPVFKGYTRQTH